MAIDLHALADQVTDESSLIDFISVLAGDREDELAKAASSPTSPFGPGTNGWEKRGHRGLSRGCFSMGSGIEEWYALLHTANKPLDSGGAHFAHG